MLAMIFTMIDTTFPPQIRPLREALFGVVESVEGQTMLEVRQETTRSPRARKEKARRDASSPPSTEKGRQRQAVTICLTIVNSLEWVVTLPCKVGCYFSF